MADIVSLRDGDPRLGELHKAIDAVIQERGDSIPVASVVGVLRMVEFDLLRYVFEEMEI